MIKNIFNISDLSKNEILEIINFDKSIKTLIDKNIGMILKITPHVLDYPSP